MDDAINNHTEEEPFGLLLEHPCEIPDGIERARTITYLMTTDAEREFRSADGRLQQDTCTMRTNPRARPPPGSFYAQKIQTTSMISDQDERDGEISSKRPMG